MKKSNILILLLITSGILIFLLGFGVGSVYNAKDVSQIKKAEKITEAIGKLNSENSSITLYGKVENIEGQNITLASSGGSMVVSVLDDAKIFSVSPSAPPDNAIAKQPSNNPGLPSSIRKAELKDIKKDDNLNVRARLTSSGEIEAVSIIILSSSK